MDRVIVLEVNELAPRVVRWWADRTPDSALARVLRTGTMTETRLDEELPRDLYPSQSWASLGTGVPWADHGVFWYGDPKSADHPFYWQAAAAAGRSVGLVGALHSSPLATQTADPAFRFVIPDSFGDELATIPDDLGALHRLNAKLTRESARVASLRPSPGDVVGALSFARHGVRPSTWADLVRLAGNVAAGRWNRERLRAGQALLQSDVFEAQMRRFDPDLGVLFTNHVASFMHRYWAAVFPEDWERPPYGDDWRRQHADELPYAMRVLDRMVDRLDRFARSTDRTLLIVSSMGQQADLTVDDSARHQAVIRDPARFLTAAGLEPAPEVRGAMVPQLTLALGPGDDAEAIESSLRGFLGDGLTETMVAGEAGERTLTVTYHLGCDGDRVYLGGAWVDPATVGISIEPITDHRSGRHHPVGILVANRRRDWADEIDALAVAPLILDELGLAPLDHHRHRVAA